MNLERKMPYFLKHNEVIIKKKLYLKNRIDNFTFDMYSPAYLTTTENINGYYDLMNFKNKNILTVVGSSDQIFEAINRGAKNVDAFDISIYAIMFYYLKEAALKALTYEEYISFFYFDNSFNKCSFLKLIPYLNEKALSFWKLIFHVNNPKKVIMSPFLTEMNYLINNFGLTINNLKNVTSYLDKNNFNLLKEKINLVNIRIFLKEVKELDSINGIYDYIILSNIIDYQHNYYYLFMEAINRYMEKITLNGEIKVGYLYRKPNEYELKNFQIDEITNFLETLTNTSYASKHYILTKKKN